GPAAGHVHLHLLDPPDPGDDRHLDGQVRSLAMATHALAPAAVAYRPGLYEWLTTTDHKKIGIMYVINSFLFFLIGGIFALGVRTELAAPGIQLFTNAHVYIEAFSIHATVMIFLFIIPMLAGLGNFAVPLMIGAPDMAFPRVNALSFWM